jgi:hypothetical protein
MVETAQAEEQQVYKVLFTFTVKAKSQEEANGFIYHRMTKLAEWFGWEKPQQLEKL